jgi:hypothetical protein
MTSRFELRHSAPCDGARDRHTGAKCAAPSPAPIVHWHTAQTPVPYHPSASPTLRYGHGDTGLIGLLGQKQESIHATARRAFSPCHGTKRPGPGITFDRRETSARLLNDFRDLKFETVLCAPICARRSPRLVLSPAHGPSIWALPTPARTLGAR